MRLNPAFKARKLRIECIGAWLSSVEHSAGGRGVAGSNPVAPTFN